MAHCNTILSQLHKIVLRHELGGWPISNTVDEHFELYLGEPSLRVYAIQVAQRSPIQLSAIGLKADRTFSWDNVFVEA